MFGGFDGLINHKMGVNRVNQIISNQNRDSSCFGVIYWFVQKPGYVHTLKRTIKNGEVALVIGLWGAQWLEFRRGMLDGEFAIALLDFRRRKAIISSEALLI